MSSGATSRTWVAKYQKTWSDLRNWRRDFPECDDGYLAEGVSEFVTASLAKRWGDLPSLLAETREDPDFEKWVLRHVDATADPGNLQIIVDNAKTGCPGGLASLCKLIAHTAKRALYELEHVGDHATTRPVPLTMHRRPLTYCTPT